MEFCTFRTIGVRLSVPFGCALSICRRAPWMLTHLQIAIEMHALTGLEQHGSSSPQGGATESAQTFVCVRPLFQIG